ncbi:acyl-CoA dehydrogenase family protein [Streptomyces olivaceiscleroticus]|uniref:Actinorhodin polyketide dimerase ActVA n=1 Tax=Streptomyces olivaceiscleroticus TaxID=68245 RepID=A0ABN1AIH1_9ACTN
MTLTARTGDTGLVQASSEVAELATQWAASADETGRLEQQAVDAVVSAGFARHFVPTRWGGHGGTFTAWKRAVAQVGASCGATAWTASLAAGVGRMAGYLPLDGQRDVWGDGPDALVVASFTPAGTAERVAGGWRLSGQWRFVSSVEYADWALVLAPSIDGRRFFAIPRADYSVRETWSNLGMRATGSDTLVVDDVVVPDSRSCLRADLNEGTPMASTERCHRVRLKAVTGLMFAAPMLGAAQGVLRESVSESRRHVGSSTLSATQLAAHRLAVARSSAAIDAARLLLDRVANTADEDLEYTDLRVAQDCRDTAFAAELLCEATDRLIRVAGTGAFAGDRPVQRFWRDVQTSASHAALRFADRAEAYADLIWESSGQEGEL